MSAENARFKALLKLAHSSRERRRSGLSLLDGMHLVCAYRDCIGLPEQIAVSVTASERQDIQELLLTLQSQEVLLLTDELFGALSTVETPTGIVAAVKTPRPSVIPRQIECCVMLEDIQDPGNLGSILRSTAGAGIKQIFLSKGTVHAWSPRVLRAGMGAHFMLQIYEQTDLLALTRSFGGKVIATGQHAKKAIFNVDLAGRVALVFGNEGAGLSQALVDAADEIVAVPMPGKIESLNVAATAAICLFERVRQLQGRGCR